MVDLRFAEGPADPDLVFGSTGDPPVILALGSSAVAPLVVAPIAVSAGGEILGSAALSPVPTSGLSVAYDNAVNRAPFRWAETPWRAAAARRVGCSVAHRATRSSQTDARAACVAADRRRAAVATLWQPMSGDRRPLGALPWGTGSRIGVAMAARFQPFWMGQRRVLALPFASGTPLPALAAAPWRELFRWARPAGVGALGCRDGAVLVAGAALRRGGAVTAGAACPMGNRALSTTRCFPPAWRSATAATLCGRYRSVV
jgi:hypothetical protein